MSQKCSNFLLATICAILFMTSSENSHASDLQTAVQLMNQGQKLVDQGRYREAIEVFQRMSNACGANEECQAASLFWIGRSYLELSQFHEAERFVIQAQDKYRTMKKPLEEASAKELRARILQGKNEYAGALELYNQAEEAIRRYGKNDSPERFAILANRARLYIYQNNYERALRDIDDAKKLIRSKANPRMQGILLEHEGLIASEKGEYPKAIKLFDEALKLYREAKNSSGQCAVLNKRGRVYESLGEYSKAVNDYEASLNIARQVGNKADEAFAWNNLGMVHRKRGNYEKSLQAYDMALKLRSPDAQPQFYSETLANKALVGYLMHSDTQQALRAFRECLDAAEKAQALGTQARALHNLAYVMKDEGRFKESRELSQKAIQMARQIGQQRFEAQAILRLGNLYEYYGAFDDSLKQYTEAEKIQRTVGDQFFRSTTLVDMANIETRLGQIKDANTHFEEALKLRKNIGVPTAETLCNIALFFLEKHRYVVDHEGRGPSDEDYRQAWRYLEQAKKELAPNVIQDKLIVDYAVGRYFLDKDPTKAAPIFRDLGTTAKQGNRLRYQFLARWGLGKAYESLAQFADAEKEYQAAVELAEKLRETLDVEAQRTFLDGEPILGVKYVSAYEGLARVRLRQGNWDGALKASEYTKARAFADKLAKLSAGSSYGVDPNLLSELDKAEKQIRANAKQLERCQGPEGDKSLIPRLESERNGLDERLKTVKRRIKERYPDFYDTRFPSPLSIKQANLPPDKLILAYDVTETGILIFVCKGTQIIHAEFKPIPRAALQKKIRHYRDPLEGPEDYDELTKMDLAAGRDLASLLLTQDVRRHVEPGRSLIVVPDDCLEVLPFEMLIMEKGGTITLQKGLPLALDVPFLGNTNPVVYFQSLTAMNVARQRPKAKSTQGKVLVIADVIVPKEEASPSSMQDRAQSKPAREYVETLAIPTQSSSSGETRLLSPGTYLDLRDEFGPLPETRSLAKTAREVFKTRAVVMEREQATLKGFQEKVVPTAAEYAQIVFATHGYFGDRFKPEISEPFLLLSCKPPQVDNLLRMSAVMDLDLRADNVALLACQTGLGRYIAGEGTMGMGRAFQYAGAKSVLVSLWSVDEKPSVMLVQRFLEEQASGKEPGVALEGARQFLKEQGYNHPFFWSSFILVGQPSAN
jgi:tetratricopeptide (TPR) repeat protein